MISPMLVASLTAHKGKGFFASNNGFETPYLYAGGALALAFTGFGAFSLDAMLGLTGLTTSAYAAIAVAVGVLGGLAALALRKPVARPAEARG
jgi:putative oxidoreductase